MMTMIGTHSGTVLCRLGAVFILNKEGAHMKILVLLEDSVMICLEAKEHANAGRLTNQIINGPRSEAVTIQHKDGVLFVPTLNVVTIEIKNQ